MSAKTKTQLVAEIKVLQKRLAELQMAEPESHRKSEINKQLMRLEDEDKFQILFNNAPDAYYISSMDGILIEGNQAAEKITGYKREELIGSSFLKKGLISNDQLLKAVKLLLRNKTGQSTGPDEFILTRKDSTKLFVEIRTQPAQIKGKKVILGIARDITERKRLEKKILLDNQMLVNIIDSIMLYKVSDGKIVYTNPQFEELFGYNPGELIGKHVSVLNLHDEKRTDEISKKISGELIKNGKWEGEIQNIKKDGSTFWSHASISGFTHDEFGEVWVSVQQDISERKQAQLELTLLATHDSLTGLYNRAFFDEEMSRLEHGRRFPISIVMADIDGLKKINDSYGHASGDSILQRAASVFAKSFRGEDMVARIGGDEFAALLPNTDAKSVDEVLMRIESNIKENNEANKEIPLSISYGAITAKNGKALMGSLAMADKIMYENKKKGESRQ